MTQTQRLIALIMVASRIAAASNIQEDRYAPVINQSPRHYIIFKVCKSKAIHKKVKVVVYTEYVTNRIEPQCVIVTARFEGASVPRQRSIYHTIALKPNEHCRSEKIALDEVVPGFCRWSSATVGHIIIGYGPKYRFDSDLEVKKLNHCTQHYESNYYVNSVNEILDLKNKSTDAYLGRNCISTYHINILERKHAE